MDCQSLLHCIDVIWWKSHPLSQRVVEKSAVYFVDGFSAAVKTAGGQERYEVDNDGESSKTASTVSRVQRLIYAIQMKKHNLQANKEKHAAGNRCVNDAVAKKGSERKIAVPRKIRKKYDYRRV